MTYVIISGLGFYTGSKWSGEYPDAEIFTSFAKAYKTASQITHNKNGKKLPVMIDGENLDIVENYGMESERVVCMLNYMGVEK